MSPTRTAPTPRGRPAQDALPLTRTVGRRWSQFSLVGRRTVAPRRADRRQRTDGERAAHARPRQPGQQTTGRASGPRPARQGPPRDRGRTPASAAVTPVSCAAVHGPPRRAGRPPWDKAGPPAARPEAVGSRRPAAVSVRVDVPQHRCRGWYDLPFAHAGNAPGERLLDRRAQGLARRRRGLSLRVRNGRVVVQNAEPRWTRASDPSARRATGGQRMSIQLICVRLSRRLGQPAGDRHPPALAETTGCAG